MKDKNEKPVLIETLGIIIRCSLLILIFSGCIPLFKGIQQQIDVSPPVLSDYEQMGSGQVRIRFSETVSLVPGSLLCHGGGEVQDYQDNSSELNIQISDWDDPGQEYELEGSVEDGQQNMLWFRLPFYGYNPNPATLMINEFINENSSSRFEKAELRVTRAGNLGGIAVYNGAPEEFNSRMVFSSQEVQLGEYLIIHFRYREEEGEEILEIDEYGEDRASIIATARSNQASSAARDFWVRGYQGLSDSNGAISIASTPAKDAEILDAVLWSNRTFEEGAKYNSFGTSYTANVMEALGRSGAWSSQHESIRPEDCIRTEPSTSTRSLNRYPEADSNSTEDWYVCVTSGSTFGEENNPEEYQ